MPLISCTSTPLRLLSSAFMLATVMSQVPGAVDLKLDINQRAANTPANTEGGFLPFAITDPASGVVTGATTNSLTVGAQTVTITGTGIENSYDDRKRAAPVNNTIEPASFTEEKLLQDFIFATYNGSTNPEAGLDIEITGLTAGNEYAITLWSFDTSSGGSRVSDWTVNGELKSDDYIFDGRQAPESNPQYQLNFNGTADASGTLLISARRDAASIDTAGAAQHGVFLNALWIRDTFIDTDADLMADGWESLNGLVVGVNDALLDADADFLNNLGEFEAQTNPQDNDSDDDGVLDGYERSTGTFVSTTNTGTKPLNPDTDGDGLLDGTENPNLVFTPSGFPGTDPNQYDTDGDGFGDGTEIAWPSNPRDPQLFPNPGAGATLAVDLDNDVAGFPQPGFVALPGSGAGDVDSLIATIGSYTVTVAAAGTAFLQSRDRAAAAGGGDFNPLFRDFVFASSSDLDGDGLDIVVEGLAPLTAYPVTLWSWDPTSAGTPRRSTWLASDGANPPVVKVPLYSLEGVTPLPAGPADRRLQFTATTDAAGTLVIQGRKEDGYTGSTINVFLNAFVIGAPQSVTPPPIVITAVGPATAQGLSFAFTSEDNATYRIDGSPDLKTWTTIDPSVDGQTGTTSFTDTTAPEGTRSRYYRVSRVP